MCECYTIGGPFIAEDPDCPLHGREAQQRQLNIEEEQALMQEEMASLRAEVAEMRRLIAEQRKEK